MSEEKSALVRTKKNHESYPALRAIYPKAKEQATRIALALHCLDAAIAGNPLAGVYFSYAS
jgi:hypothetical protein